MEGSEKIEMARRPKCRLTGLDSWSKCEPRISWLVSVAAEALRKDSLFQQAQEMTDKCMSCECYHEALAIIDEYVEIT